MKEINFFLNPPFFYFHGNCGKVCPTDCDFFGLSHSTRYGCDRKYYSMATAAKFVLLIAIFLAYLIQLDMDVTGNITAKLCEVGSEFNIFRTLVTMATAAILNFFNPPKAATHYSGYSYKVS
jgi:hypothetical protein